MNIITTRNTCLTALLGLTLLLSACDNQQPEPPAQQSSEGRFSQAVEESRTDQAAQQPGMGDPHAGLFGESSPGSAKAVVPFAELEVEKASGDNAHTVGELFAQGEELDGQQIRVRGQVVKFSPAIMQRNFVHLQDGSGAEAEQSHNLVITSQEIFEVGDIVTIEGTLAANRDFGAGYNYVVILEEARIVE